VSRRWRSRSHSPGFWARRHDSSATSIEGIRVSFGMRCADAQDGSRRGPAATTAEDAGERRLLKSVGRGDSTTIVGGEGTPRAFCTRNSSTHAQAVTREAVNHRYSCTGTHRRRQRGAQRATYRASDSHSLSRKWPEIPWVGFEEGDGLRSAAWCVLDLIVQVLIVLTLRPSPDEAA
jgi:hypothetical protein